MECSEQETPRPRSRAVGASQGKLSGHGLKVQQLFRRASMALELVSCERRLREQPAVRIAHHQLCINKDRISKGAGGFGQKRRPPTQFCSNANLSLRCARAAQSHERRGVRQMRILKPDRVTSSIFSNPARARPRGFHGAARQRCSLELTSSDLCAVRRRHNGIFGDVGPRQTRPKTSENLGLDIFKVHATCPS